MRKFLAANLRLLRAERRRGVISDFSRSDFDTVTPFTRLGAGSMGGKARGIAFAASILSKLDLSEKFPQVRISVPQTIAIGTDAFARFLEDNDLKNALIDCDDDDEVARLCLAGMLDDELLGDLRAMLQVVHFPLAIRSSSLLEDSASQPFAGLYATFMTPNSHADIEVRLRQLTDAIKLVYASIFTKAPKAHFLATAYRIEEEKMAVLIQQLVARRYENVCYPNFAGVAQSYNFYPIGWMKAEEGMANLALGLGKTVVEGGNVVRFSPSQPKVPVGMSSTREIKLNSQRHFYALDLSAPDAKIKPGSDGPLVRLDLRDAQKHGTLKTIGSRWIRDEEEYIDGEFVPGPPLITFTSILKEDRFPLGPILEELLSIGKNGMGHEVEIEFAVNLASEGSDELDEFSVLQFRPLVSNRSETPVSIGEIEEERLICQSDVGLGNGVFEDLCDIVFVSPDRWDNASTFEMARQVGRINIRLQDAGRRFVLIGMGRWGTSEPTHGIPVEWNDISMASVIVEVGSRSSNVVPSQGSHFFHNIASLGIGYLTIGADSEGASIDWRQLENIEPEADLGFVRHVHLSSPLEVLLDGKDGRGVVLLPK
ncbi:MAG: hypothetical protein HN348_22735 [Proteobacteria bacterium]|nr:hypothetical protein [Pseudomonadota bacterium]